PQHVGRQHQHRDADPRKDREPPPSFHQTLTLLGHHEPPGRLWWRDSHTQEAERRLDDHGNSHLQAEDHHHGVDDVGHNVPENDPELTHSVDLRELHEVPLTNGQHLTPRHARAAAPENQGQDDDDVP